MPRKAVLALALAITYSLASAQELYVSTEPASNMATGSLGIRLNSTLILIKPVNVQAIRFNPEIMLGLSKSLMLHLNFYASNMYQSRFAGEGGGVYVKYRFLSNDEVQRHFRLAAYGKLTLVNNPAILQRDGKQYASDEIDLDGSNSGYTAGLVATQLLHKVAISASTAYLARIGPTSIQSRQAITYSLSGGYLLSPAHYVSFDQTNINVYLEFVGGFLIDKPGGYLDVAPAVQFIFHSINRLDFSYRTQLAGGGDRLTAGGFLLRLETNFLNLIQYRHKHAAIETQ